MNFIDLFSGIGGFALAITTIVSGSQNVAHTEIDEYACNVYHKQFPNSVCLGDIKEVNWKPYENRINLICGGFPCQPHSTAGKRLASKDERNLWDECRRALREIRPDYALFENVPGIITSEKGTFFQKVLCDIVFGYPADLF